MMIYKFVALFLLSFNAYSESFFHKISDDVKIEYQQDGLVKIYSTDIGQQNHYFSLKLKSLSSNKQQSVLGIPLSVSQVGHSIIYKWNENILDEWQLVDKNIVRKLTIKEKPSVYDSNEKLIINSYFKTDLGFISVGLPVTYKDNKAIFGDLDAIDNLRIDERAFYLIDSNCKQLVVDKNQYSKGDYQRYKIENKNIEYPITLIQDIKINQVLSFDRSKYDREVVVNGTTLAISNHSQNIVKLYENKNDKWHHVQTIQSEVPNGIEYKGKFGSKMALSNNTLAIAAYDSYSDSVCTDCDVAAVNLYKKVNGQWIKQTRLVAPYKPNKNVYGNFGSSLDIYQDKLVVGDDQTLHEFTGKNWDMMGAVYLFKEVSDKWQLEETILPNDNDRDFGKSVAIDNNTLIIGGTHSGNYTGKTIDIKEVDYGQLHVYHFKNKKWQKQSKIKFTDLNYNHIYDDTTFADSIDISGNTIVVGNPLYFDIGVRGNSRSRSYKFRSNIDFYQFGEVYVFKKQGNKWKKQARLQAPNPLQLDHFGQSVKIVNNTIVVGAYGDSSKSAGINGASDNCQLPSSGAVYVFDKKWDGWKQSAYIKAANPIKMDLFGDLLDSDGKTIIVNSKDIHIFNKQDGSWKKVKQIKTHPIKRSEL